MLSLSTRASRGEPSEDLVFEVVGVGGTLFEEGMYFCCVGGGPVLAGFARNPFRPVGTLFFLSLERAGSSAGGFVSRKKSANS